jgi:hypothetical protein
MKLNLVVVLLSKFGPIFLPYIGNSQEWRKTAIFGVARKVGVVD